MDAPREIERKFLVNLERLPKRMPQGEKFVQAYLCVKPAVRVRIVDGARAFMTVKGEGLESREEIEFKIPLDKAQYLVKLSPFHVIHKTRFKLKRGDLVWEVDLYEGPLHGLATAEVELNTIDQKIEIPEFVGKEVTMDPRYKNSALAAKGLPK